MHLYVDVQNHPPWKRTNIENWWLEDDKKFPSDNGPNIQGENCEKKLGGDTPQKSNIDIKNCNFLKGVTFSKPSFWVPPAVSFQDG